LILAVVAILIVAGVAVYYASITGLITLPFQTSGQPSAPQAAQSGAGQATSVPQSPASGGAGNEPAAAGNEGAGGGSPASQPITGQATGAGATPAVTPHSGGGSGGGGSLGGGGGGSSGGGGGTPACEPEWTYSAWTECSPQGSWSRTAADIRCNTGSRTETGACTYVPPQGSRACSDGICVLPTVASAKVGENFMVEVYANTTKEIFGIEVHLVYDPAIINATGVAEGIFLKQDGKSTSSLSMIENGKAVFASTRLSAASGNVVGEGTIAQITFKAIKSGSTQIGISNLQPLKAAGTPPVPVSVQLDAHNATAIITA